MKPICGTTVARKKAKVGKEDKVGEQTNDCLLTPSFCSYNQLIFFFFFLGSFFVVLELFSYQYRATKDQ